VTLTLAWAIASWVASTFLGALAGAFAYGLAIGRWKQKVEGCLDKLSARLDAAEKADTAVSEAAREGRERIHREMDGVNSRLKGGDEKFEKHLVDLTKLGANLTNTADELHAYVELLGDFVAKGVCKEKHTGIEHRLDRLEAPKR